MYPPYGTLTSYYGVSAIDFATSGNNKYSQDGRRTNDVVAFRHNRRGVVSRYGVCPWSKTALVLIYMILFGHGLPGPINKNLF